MYKHGHKRLDDATENVKPHLQLHGYNVTVHGWMG